MWYMCVCVGGGGVVCTGHVVHVTHFRTSQARLCPSLSRSWASTEPLLAELSPLDHDEMAA